LNPWRITCSFFFLSITGTEGAKPIGTWIKNIFFIVMYCFWFRDNGESTQFVLRGNISNQAFSARPGSHIKAGTTMSIKHGTKLFERAPALLQKED
jgi:hypothetical protein